MDGCPLQLITDCGTENGIAASMQCFFRQNANDELAGEKSHIDTAPHHPTNASKRGGPSSGDTDRTGG